MTATSPAPASAATPDAERSRAEQLDLVWRDAPGLWGKITSVNHKTIALRYIVTAFVFFILGGVEAGLMRVQLARPENAFIGPDLYNQLFTVHGTTMMFLFAVPVVEAMGLYFVPLMLGTRNVAFPRLNAYGYWTYLVGGVLLYAGLLTNTGPDAGWFSYVPLAGPEYSPGKRMDIWAQTVTFTEIAGIIAAVEIIVTAFKQRAPGMSLDRVPLFVWSMVVVSFMVLFAMPVVAVASTMFLGMDRLVGTHFFNVSEGGDPVLWQHLFWFFGHPEVYIIFLPALGMVSTIIPTFTRRPVFGYTAIVLSMVGTGFLSFGLWVHHMYATPLPQLGQSFFTAASAAIAIPSGVQVFCWIATLWSGRPRFTTPMLFALGFLVLFVFGGISGVMLAAVPIDLQVHDTFFVPGHIHYVVLGGMLFPLFGAWYYWFPKVTGRLLDERAGKLHFWLLFVAMNVTFFPFMLLGIEGMPRRVYTYLPETGWQSLNVVASVGAAIFVLGVLVFIGNVWRSLRSGERAGPDPWRADTLEWATASPAPSYNFERLPVVHGRSALWGRDELEVVDGLDDRHREVLLTTMLDAEPDVRHEQPGHTVAPLLLALATAATFVGLVFTPWALVFGPALAFPALLVWAWPRGRKPGEHDPVELLEPPR